MGDTFGCGCGGSGIDWEEFERIIREIEEGDDEPEAIPVEDDSVFTPVRKREEVEADR